MPETRGSETLPSYWRLVAGLIAWSLVSAQPIVGSLLAGLGGALTWWFLRYPTWSLTRAQLHAKLGWRDGLNLLALIACLYVASVGLAMIEALLPGIPVQEWALFTVWLLVSMWAITRFVIARRHWQQAARD